MLSILLPVYNFNVVEYVQDLHRLCDRAGISYEILCYDDGSESEFREKNRGIDQLKNVKYKELPENLGRSKIRNKMADKAAYEHLLFTDCDSKIANGNFIESYLKAMTPNSLVYGGRLYQRNPPGDPNKKLHWLYGTKRESTPVELRKLKPYHAFMTNNFMIPKAVYQKIRLNEQLSGYGHEDTLFGKSLKENKVKIKHIQNPLYHIGLEDAAVFLEKTDQALENLSWMIKNEMVDTDIKLYRYYKLVKKSGLAGFFRKSFQKRKQIIMNNLLSEHPNLRTLDFYKLGILLELMEKAQHVSSS